MKTCEDIPPIKKAYNCTPRKRTKFERLFHLPKLAKKLWQSTKDCEMSTATRLIWIWECFKITMKY